jgi:hypothetical protein
MSYIKSIKRKVAYTLNELRWVKALFSPFKPFKVRFYAGKTRIGVPYFLPRKFVKATPKLATEAALKHIKYAKDWNERNPDSTFKHTVKPFGEVYDEKMRCMFPVPIKVGFSSCGLGWKTKWSEYDIRHEWNPVLSFVFFGYQIALTVYNEHGSHYWESWIAYEYLSDKTKTKMERIEFCREKCPQTWTRHEKDGTKTTTDYYDLILKKKYLS